MSENRSAKKQQVGRPFKKGQSGNPKGRPKGTFSLTTELKKQLAENPSAKEAIIERVLDMAVDGDLDAVKMVWERTDGRPKQEVAATVVTHTPVDLSKLSDEDLDLIHEKLASATLSPDDDDSDSDD